MEALVYLAYSAPAIITFWYYARRYGRRLPPGPVGIPILGNILNVTPHEQWRIACEWGKRYGGIIYLDLLGTPFAFINGREEANELLNKRSAISSDRPHLTMAGELCGLSKLVPLTRYGQRFKIERKMMHDALSSSSVEQWRRNIAEETKSLLKDICSQPDDFIEHIKRLASSIIFTATYGYRIQSHHDPFVHAAEEFMEVSSYMIIGGWIADFVPFVKHIPWLSFQRTAAACRANIPQWVDKPHEMFINLPDTPAKRSSFCGKLLYGKTEGGEFDFEREDHVKWLATSLYGAGADTTVAALVTFIMAMVLYPESQKKLQAEIDRVVGTERLPSFGDRPSMPYSEWVFKEILRWGTPVPLTPPHRLMKEDQYEGLRLPEGTAFIANMWAMLHDETLYKDPLEFNPDRFDVSDPELSKRMDPDNFAFGFGRRRCPGVHFANQSIWLAIVYLAASFDILPALSDDGTPILPEVSFSSGAFRHPKPFRCRFVLRRDGLLSSIP